MAVPTLGYDKPTEATIDTVNQWMRQEPWYQELMAQWGQDPGHPTLTKQQAQTVLKAAQGQGVVVDEGDMEIDNHGNFNPKGHKLRNTLIVAGLAGASLATMGAAGVFGGAAAGGAEATGLGATGGVLAGLPGAGTALGGAAGAVLPSTAIGTGLATLPIGGTGLAGGAAATGAAGNIGTALASGGSTYDKIEGLLRAGGSAVGAATGAAGQNRLTQETLGLRANDSNISGQTAFENELMNRSKLEMGQRNDALKNVYRASYAKNRPTNPYNPHGQAAFSPEYMKALADLEGQGGQKLATGPQYDTNGMPALKPYTPLDIKDVQGSTGTKKGTLETIGDWLAPGMSVYGAASQLWK